MPKITVISPTIRPEGMELVKKALRQQTFREYEHIIVSRKGDSEPNTIWTVNREYNRAIMCAKGELIVSWQDYTYAKPYALEKFWMHYEVENSAVISGVGDKYENENWQVITWQDPRKRGDQGSFYPCYFNDIEFNFCAIPKKAFYDVGGFDESLDSGYGMDGYSVVDRLNMVGRWEFYLDQTNETFSLEHGRPKEWDEKNWNGDKYLKHRERYIENPKLEYL